MYYFMGIHKETEELLEAVKGIVSPDNPTTARFVLYKLISIGALQSTKQYDKLLNHIRDARIRGDLEDECFLDNKRTVATYFPSANLSDYIESMKHLYKRDRWADQPQLPLILVEKGTVGDVLRETCRKYQVPLFISSGYYSRPFLVRLADMILKRKGRVNIGYVGDGDPSGFDIERAARRGNGGTGVTRREGLFEILQTSDNNVEWFFLEETNQVSVMTNEDATRIVTWERLAITDEDLRGFEEYQLVPVKDKDTRAKTFVEAHGESARRGNEYFGSEVEALDLGELQSRVRNHITMSTDDTVWQETEALEEEDLERLSSLGN
jgi:hypothetical protein